ncbi:MAG TPA: Rieske (2Fe-2S) protein [Ignavibacteriaceae bacterium]|jgi:Rieske Fe-S protein
MNEVIKDSKQSGRRDFLNTVLKGGFFAWLAAVIYPIYNFLEPPKAKESKISQLTIGKIEDMAKNSGKIVKFGNKPVLVIRKPTGDYAAYNAVCTHLDCIVQYRQDYGQIYCACHNGRYDLNGKNISGPPPAPLDKYSVAIKNDDVIIYKNAG